MPDYKEMYLTMVRETEKAIEILINVQRKCEEMYINAPEPEIILLPQNFGCSNGEKMDSTSPS